MKQQHQNTKDLQTHSTSCLQLKACKLTLDLFVQFVTKTLLNPTFSFSGAIEMPLSKSCTSCFVLMCFLGVNQLSKEYSQILHFKSISVAIFSPLIGLFSKVSILNCIFYVVFFIHKLNSNGLNASIQLLTSSIKVLISWSCLRISRVMLLFTLSLKIISFFVKFKNF